MASRTFTDEDKERILKDIIVDVSMGGLIMDICKKNDISHWALYQWLNDSSFRHYRTLYNNAKYQAEERQTVELVSLAKVKLIDKVNEGNIIGIKLALEMPAAKHEVKINVINKLSDRLDELNLSKSDYTNIIKVLKEIERE